MLEIADSRMLLTYNAFLVYIKIFFFYIYSVLLDVTVVTVFL